MQNLECDNNTEPASSRMPTKSCLFVVVALFCVMVAVSALPDTANALSAINYSKLWHVTAFALTGTLAFIIAPGRIDELLQLVLPYRNPTWLDWRFDMPAALTNVGMLMLVLPFFMVRRASSLAQINNRSVRKP